MDELLQSNNFSILKCNYLTDEVLTSLKQKVDDILDENTSSNIVRNLYDISTWTELHELWNNIEKFCLCTFPICMKTMYFSHKTYGGVMICNAPINVNTNQKWHRDTDYKSYTVCIPLVPTSKKNGCTQILPDTIGALPKSWRKYYSKSIDLECELGQIVIFDGRILHRGLKNMSQHNRSMIIGTMSTCGFTNDFQLQ